MPREPAAHYYARLFSTRDDAEKARDARSGLRPSTVAKFEELRALRGSFKSRSAVFQAVGLANTFWGYISHREPALAEHVRSLVARDERSRDHTT